MKKKLNPSAPDEFMFSLDGLIYGDYVRIETDSKAVLHEIIKIMDVRGKQ